MEAEWERRIRGHAVLGVLVMLQGCVSLGRGEPPQRHYVLGGTAPSTTTESTAPAEVTVAIRRAKVASYLAVPFIAVRRGESEIYFSEFHRWGEPLDEGINRVVARLLKSRGLREVAVAPWPASASYDYVIQLDVSRFEGVVGDDGAPEQGRVHLSDTWEILRQQDGVVLARGATDRTSSGWTVGDYSGLVALLDEELDALALDLVTGIAALGQRPTMEDRK